MAMETDFDDPVLFWSSRRRSVFTAFAVVITVLLFVVVHIGFRVLLSRPMQISDTGTAKQS